MLLIDNATLDFMFKQRIVSTSTSLTAHSHSVALGNCDDMIVPIIITKPPSSVILKDDFLLKSVCVVFPDDKTHKLSICNDWFETSTGTSTGQGK